MEEYVLFSLNFLVIDYVGFSLFSLLAEVVKKETIRLGVGFCREGLQIGKIL